VSTAGGYYVVVKASVAVIGVAGSRVEDDIVVSSARLGSGLHQENLSVATGRYSFATGGKVAFESAVVDLHSNSISINGSAHPPSSGSSVALECAVVDLHSALVNSNSSALSTLGSVALECTVIYPDLQIGTTGRYSSTIAGSSVALEGGVMDFHRSWNNSVVSINSSTIAPIAGSVANKL
jgi:hypothetical protein